MSAPQKPPMGAAEHITRAKQELAAGDHTAAQTHALIAITAFPGSKPRREPHPSRVEAAEAAAENAS